MDFPLLTDAKIIIVKFLKREFGLLPVGSSTEEIFMSYFNLKHKFITKQPREVLISEGLLNKVQLLGLLPVLLNIKEKFIAGADINPFLSKGIFQLDKHDYLLNYWGIHHLHLNGTKKKPAEYFFDRSDHLLFAHITGTQAYFIDVRPHQENYVFAQRDLLRAVRANWPDLDRKFLVQEAEMEVYLKFEEKDIALMRRKGYMFFTQVDKHAYMPGLGSACSGFSMKAGLEMDEFLRHLYKIHSYVIEHEEELRLRLAKGRPAPLSILHISLVFKDWVFYVYEINSQQFVDLDLKYYQPQYSELPESL